MTDAASCSCRPHGVGLVLGDPGGRPAAGCCTGARRSGGSPEPTSGPSAAGAQQADRRPARSTPPGTCRSRPRRPTGGPVAPGLQVRRGGVLHHPRWAPAARRRPTATACVVTRPGRGIRPRARDPHRDRGRGSGLGGRRAPARRERRAPHRSRSTGSSTTLPVLDDDLDAHRRSTGAGPREKRPVTTGMPPGSTVRQSRRGRGGHDHPMMFDRLRGRAAVGRRPGLGRAPRVVVGLHVSASIASPTPATLLGAGELLRPGRDRARSRATSTPRRARPSCSRATASTGCRARVHRWLRARDAAPDDPAAADAQHVGGGLLRPPTRAS